RRREIQRVLHVARGMIRGHVEGLEVVIIVLELWSFDDQEPHAEEDLFDALAQQCERMTAPEQRRTSGQRYVDGVGGGCLTEQFFLRLELRFGALFETVERLAKRSTLVRRLSGDSLQLEGDPAVLARQVLVADSTNLGLRVRRAEILLELLGE